MIPAGALLVALITWAAVWWLQGSVSARDGDFERASLRVEAIRTGLSVGAGAAAALALLLAFRRQQVAELTHLATEYDAAERRITELYVKAADQLGSEKAPVRLAGLYALERLAQNNRQHRQSIVDVFCAYLRMPYTPPAGYTPIDGSSTPTEYSTHYSNGPLATPTTEPIAATKDWPAADPREERQVRLAAQRILASHLRPTTDDGTPDALYWSRQMLDLTEATLIEVDFSNCILYRANFNRTIFSDDARFDGTTFSGDARFGEARFGGAARFDGATFNGDARFDGAKFSSARFVRATFSGDAAWFGGATFSGDAGFDGTTFSGDARFGEARFGGAARFDGATFSGAARFVRTTFSGAARFDRATFSGAARFDRSAFNLTARLNGVVLGWFDRDNSVWPEGWHFDPTTRVLVRDAFRTIQGTAASSSFE